MPLGQLTQECCAYTAGMATPVDVDAIDRAILDLLVADGRRTVTDIAARVNLSPAPVKRRIDRLERLGVISGYSAIIDPSRLGTGFEAFVELRFSGSTAVEEIRAAVVAAPEVIELCTIAGDPDALVRIRVNDVQHLQQVVDRLRRGGAVIGTKSLIVLGSWRGRPPD
jgi:DNA-binding Lrp family transcriptional regulator